MIVHVVEQGSAAWHALRLGKPTASEFSSILTPAKLEPAKAARAYAIRLVTETLLGTPVQDLDNMYWIKRGKELEPDAVTAYEFATGVATSPCGFITTDDARIGASPDRMVDGAPGAVELKCPSPAKHMEYLFDGFGPDYRLQAQGQIMVGDLQWVDRVSYHPELPLVRVRTFRDDAIISKLNAALLDFLRLYDELLGKALAAGAVIATPPPPPTYGQPYHTIIDPNAPGAEAYAESIWSAG